MTQEDVPSATERLRFRRYRATDVESVMEMFSDEEARRWYPTNGQRDEATRWIGWNLRNYDEHGVGLWVIEDRSSGVFVGDCGLTFQPVEDDRLLEVGYHVHARHRGNGYAVEAARACARFAFDDLRVATVCSIVDPANEASMRVAAAVHESVRTFVNGERHTWNLYWTANSETRPPGHSE